MTEFPGEGGRLHSHGRQPGVLLCPGSLAAHCQSRVVPASGSSEPRLCLARATLSSVQSRAHSFSQTPHLRFCRDPPAPSAHGGIGPGSGWATTGEMRSRAKEEKKAMRPLGPLPLQQGHSPAASHQLVPRAPTAAHFSSSTPPPPFAASLSSSLKVLKQSLAYLAPGRLPVSQLQSPSSGLHRPSKAPEGGQPQLCEAPFLEGPVLPPSPPAWGRLLTAPPLPPRQGAAWRVL